MPQFRKKAIVIKAEQLTWSNWSAVCDLAGVGRLADGKPSGHQEGEEIQLLIPTLEGLMTADEGDWIIKGIKGEIYPCKPDIFEATYEEVKETSCAHREPD